jgi:16S rRNA (cytosine967-C5)-methyltransferase
MSVPGLAARRAAAALLAGVVDGGRSLSDQAGGDGPLARLAPPERARAQSLAAETLRHLGRIDGLLDRFLQRRPPATAQNALRLATAEIHLDGVPPHAAVDGAVRLVRGAKNGARLSGLVNAVGRRVAQAGPGVWEAVPEAALPQWIAGPVAAAWGAEAAAAIAAAHRRGAPLDLTPKRPEAAEALAAALGAAVLPTGSVRLSARAQVSALPGFVDGDWWVQDAAAALPARLPGPVAGLRALDVCAAPGGKTLQLAAGGAAVTALDVSEARLGRLRENLGRTGLSAEIVAADALAWAPEAAFDAVLVDAPCTATGTIRRHPDLPWLRGAKDVAPLVALQAALLDRAWGWVRPGGRLVYCVCSLLPEEGEAQGERFLARTPDAGIVAPDAAALGVEPGWVDAGGGLRLRPDFWPERGGMDGFYAICFEKRES